MIMKRQKILRLYLGRDSEKNNGDNKKHKRHEKIDKRLYIKKPKGRTSRKDTQKDRKEQISNTSYYAITKTSNY